MLPKHIVDKIMLYVSHPVADILSNNFEEYDYISNYNCDECRIEGWRCMCWEREFPSTSKIEKFYLVKDRSYKLEKILEMKMVMNWLLSKSITLHYLNAGLNELTQEERMDTVSAEWKKLEKQYPVYCHCNKDIMKNCFVMLLRRMRVKLKNYEDLYDQFDF